MQTIKITCDVTDRVDYKSIKPFQGKLKELSKENFEKIKKSILEEGFFMPIGVWAHDGRLNCLDGHQRLLVLEWLEKNGYTIPLIPVFRIIADSFKNARKKLLHMVSQYGKVTGQGLYEFSIEAEMGLADFDNFSIPDLNMDSFMQEFFEDNAVEPGCDEEETPSVPIESKSKLGDIYKLGNHILICGDSTMIDDIEKLMGGGLADMCFTDPPYNVDYDPEARVSSFSKERMDNKLGKIQNDKKSPEDFRKFLDDVYTSLNIALKESASIYISHADTEGHHFRNAFISQPWKMQSCLIWKKSVLCFGRADYQWIHEPVLYGWKEGAAHNWFGDRKQTSVIEFKTDHYNKKESDTNGYVHPTQKPVQLIEYFINNSSKKGEVVIDLFGGSGSTMIACEKTGRHARLCELDPKYVDVIVTRYLKFSKQTKVIRNGEEIDWF
jgi:site-specific DNA-methyltransferase (adenine-specific)